MTQALFECRKVCYYVVRSCVGWRAPNVTNVTLTERALEHILMAGFYSFTILIFTSPAISFFTQLPLCKQVSLPRNRWPKEWEGRYENPVVPLVLSLYVHAESGGYWEEHCEAHVLSQGWERIGWEWPSVF